MALGKKSTTVPQIGDILWADADVEVNDITYIDEVSFNAKKGDELGEITDITSSHYELESNYYVKKSASVHVMPNPDFDYPNTASTNNTGTPKTGGTGGTVWTFLGTLFGFGTEVLKKTNSSSTTTKTPTTKQDGTGGTTPDPNAAGNNSSTTTYLFIGAGVLLLILLVVIFWKPKQSVPPQVMDSTQVIKLK